MDIKLLLSRAYAAAMQDDGVATPEEVTNYLVLYIQDEEQIEARAKLEQIYANWKLDLSPAPTPFGDAARIKKLQGDALASQTAKADAKIAQVGRWITYAESGIRLTASAYTGNPLGLGAALLPLINQFIGAVNNPDTEPPATPYVPPVAGIVYPPLVPSQPVAAPSASSSGATSTHAPNPAHHPTTPHAPSPEPHHPTSNPHHGGDGPHHHPV